MDQRWSLLPEDIVEKIILCLPVRYLIQCRTLSRNYYHLLSGSSLSLKQKELIVFKVLHLDSTESSDNGKSHRIKNLLIFDSTSNWWSRPIQMPFFCDGACVAAEKHMLLYLYQKPDTPEQDLIMVDLLSLTFLSLPRIGEGDSTFITDAAGFMESSCWPRMNVLAIGRRNWKDEHYVMAKLDNDLRWTIQLTTIPVFAIPDLNLTLGFDNAFYCVAYSDSRTRVLMKILDDGGWDRVCGHVDNTGRGIQHSLISCCRKIYVVTSNMNDAVREVAIWEFQQANGSFQRVTTMPTTLIRYVRGEADRLECLGCGQFIFVRFNHPSHFVRYDIHDKTWRRAPPSQHFITSMSFSI